MLKYKWRDKDREVIEVVKEQTADEGRKEARKCSVLLPLLTQTQTLIVETNSSKFKHFEFIITLGDLERVFSIFASTKLTVIDLTN